MDISDADIEIVSKAEAVDNLCVWQMKGHSVLSAMRVYEAVEGGWLAGFSVYGLEDTVLIADSMNRPYQNYQQMLSAVGALIDAMGPDYPPFLNNLGDEL